MLNVKVVGIGNCGNQIALLAHKEAHCDVFAINTAENDLSMLPDDIPKKVIGDAEGTGKSRNAAKKFLKDSIMELIGSEEFTTFMSDAEVVLIVGSLGGGTGSGMAPITYSIIRDMYRSKTGDPIVSILVGVIPRLSEGYSTQVNTLDYAHELFDVLEHPTYMLYDNNNYAKEAAHKTLQMVNQEVVHDIEIMQCKYNIATPYDSIDSRDMKTLLSSPGLISMAGLFGLKEKDIDGTTIENLLIEKIKKSAHVELQRDGIVSRTGLITNLSTNMNETFDAHITEVRKFVGEPTEEFLHIAVNEGKSLPNNVVLILTGMTKPIDRIDKIRERIEEIEKEQAEKEALVSEVAISDEEIAKMNARRGVVGNIAADKKVNLEDTFAKFGI